MLLRAGIFVVALTIRLAAVCVFPVQTDSDASEYLSLAYHLRHEGVYSFGEPYPWGATAHFPGRGPLTPTAARPPLYPAFIAVLWNSTSTPVTAVQVTQAVMGAAAALLIFDLGTLLFGPVAACIAGFAYSLAPLSIQLGTQIMSDSLAAFLALFSIWLWYRRRSAASGIALGLAILTRPVFLPFAAALGLLWLFLRKRELVPLVLACVATVAPWTVRNLVVLHKPILVNTEGWGSALLFGTMPIPYGIGNPWSVFMADPVALEAMSPSYDVARAEEIMGDAALLRIRRHPIDWALTSLRSHPRFWLDTGTTVLSPFHLSSRAVGLAKFIFLFGNLIVSLLALAGVVMVRGRPELLPLFLFLVVLPLYHLAGFPQTRYSLPLMPVVFLFASVAVCQFFRRSYL